MEFIYELLTAVAFFCCLLLFFWMGTLYAKRKPPDQVADIQQDEEVQRKQAKLQEDFMKVMKYDVSQAMRGKKVT